MVKPANSVDLSLISGLESSPGGGNGNPLQYSCLGKSMDRGAWWATVQGIKIESAGHDLVTKPPEPIHFEWVSAPKSSLPS